MADWRRIEYVINQKVAPWDGAEVLVWGHGAMRVAIWDAKTEQFRVNAHSFVGLNPTHWMPLPEPPESA